MIENPFKYGVVVTGVDFVDRKEELKIIYNELYSGKSIVLYSERRLGKTSLIMEFIKRKGTRFIPVYIDLYGMTTKEELAKQIVNMVVKASYSKLDKIKEVLKNYFTNLRPKLIITQDGAITIDLGIEKTCKDNELIEILNFPEVVANKKKKKMILIFDEFQDLSIMDGTALEKVMRSRFQHHKNVSYLFAGSKEHLLRQMFEERSRAFFKFARPLSLGKIPKKEFIPFIEKKFKQTEGNPSKDIINKILDHTSNHPYYTQYLCHEVWYITKSPKDEKVIDQAIKNILTQQSIAYEHIWDGIKSRNQRLLLIAIASENGYNYSSDFIEKHKLKTQSNLEKSLKLLKDKGILDENGLLKDIFFREWIIRRIIEKE